MIIDGISALKGSSSVIGAAPTAAPHAAPPGTSLPATDFATALADAASNAVDVLKAGEAASISGIRGQMPVQQVVEAVMAAEQTLQATIAIRDKVVSAYLELSRMAI